MLACQNSPNREAFIVVDRNIFFLSDSFLSPAIEASYFNRDGYNVISMLIFVEFLS